MRKCRVYDKVLNIIRDVEYIDFAKEELMFYAGEFECNGGWADLDIVRSFDLVDVMWSTGLKDTNGTEIYEGDICAYYYKDTSEYCEVKWSEKNSTWMIEGDSDIEFLRDFAKHCVFEIVGNIYENQDKAPKRNNSAEN